MGSGDTLLYAKFARDSYVLNLEGDLIGKYYVAAETEGGEDILVVAKNGDVIPGDKMVTVETKTGYSVKNGAVCCEKYH